MTIKKKKNGVHSEFGILGIVKVRSRDRGETEPRRNVLLYLTRFPSYPVLVPRSPAIPIKDDNADDCGRKILHDDSITQLAIFVLRARLSTSVQASERANGPLDLTG